MELHHVGKNCSLLICKRLDFLPFKCVNCKEEFCEDHYQPASHQCQSPSPIVDVKVPVCPLCQAPVPVARGQDPNIKINEHIARGCLNEASSSTPANVCHAPNCKTKLSLVGQECNVCQLRYCLKHRFPDSHKCPGPPPALPSVTQFTNKLKSKFSPAKASNQATSNSKKGKGKENKCIIS
ncbi:hypothetical protein DSO57_1024124 [Entomophthora muscae]|uniref:Uncharacterized protein n=2 Tax=Entomophthora muscae TaxID=34485 RepID=A0ACC2RP03_9FUNG|nr:hypothetical protein DSO57_1001050 [Entomophthora muscae]KAJ9080521.1 hypothetical protein DSO57_1024124 [Entomophthora muscae]